MMAVRSTPRGGDDASARLSAEVEADGGGRADDAERDQRPPRARARGRGPRALAEHVEPRAWRRGAAVFRGGGDTTMVVVAARRVARLEPL